MPPPSDDATIEFLHQLGFRLGDEELRAFLLDKTKRRAPPLDVVRALAEMEIDERQRRNLQARTETATLGPFKTLDRFDWTWPRDVDKDLYERLSSLDFLAHGHNVLFRGQSGTGKSTLAQNLGLFALQAGYKVRFSTLAAMLADLLKQESLPALDRRMRRYVNPDLLIVDEIGYLPADNRAADLLYNIVSRRHEQRSTIITTNLAFKQWGTVFPGAACVAALVDRFVHHCHVIDIDADSWREKESSDPEPTPTKKRRPQRRPT